MAGEDYCHDCYTPLRHKDTGFIVMRTVFGKVQMKSPRYWCCGCEQFRYGQTRTISPLAQALRKRVTPELEYLQIKWAVHLPYAAATALLKEVLPLETSISASGARHRIRTAGDEIDVRVEQEVARLPFLGDAEHPRESPQVTALSVDSAWLKHCQPSRAYGQQVTIAAGRATLANGTTRVCAYVGKRVQSSAGRLDHFLGQCGVRWDERVTVISDGAGEFTTAVEGSRLARGRILDWFHIAMKFRAAEQSVFGYRQQAGPDGDGGRTRAAKREVARLARQRTKGRLKVAGNDRRTRAVAQPGIFDAVVERAQGLRIRSRAHTGIAAQNLSRYIGTAMANRSFAYCLGEVRRAQNVKDDQPLSETQMRLCLKI